MLIKIKDLTLNVFKAKSEGAQSIGLQFVDYLPKNGGMLFVYDSERTESFHMRNVYFPLDIVGISIDKRINQIHQAFPGDDNIVLKDVLYVLEVRKDLMNESGIRIGDEIEFTKCASADTDINLIKSIWKEIASKSNFIYGEIDVPNIEIQSRTGRVLASFIYPNHLDFYKHYDKAKLVISRQLLNMSENEIKDTLIHEFSHAVLWKEYPSDTNVHSQNFDRIYSRLKSASLYSEPSYTLVKQPLIEKRDYAPHGFDILEQNAKALKKKKKLPKELEVEMRDRLKGKF